MSAFPNEVPTCPDDLVIDVKIAVATGDGRELGEVERRIVLPRALHQSVLHRAESAARSAIEANAMYVVRLAIVEELERRDSTQFFRRLDTMHPDWAPVADSGNEERRRFMDLAEHLSREAEIAASD